MKIREVYKQINLLIEQSNGNPISINEDKCWFLCRKKYTKSQIEQWEKDTNILLPQEYKSFLEIVGVCDLYVNNYGGIEFYELEYLKEFASKVFEEEDNVYPKLLFIGSILNNGDIIGYNLTKKDSDKLSFYGVWDIYPEEWLEGITEFTSLDTFLQKIIESNGEDYYYML